MPRTSANISFKEKKNVNYEITWENSSGLGVKILI
jgi:hypothetical protein